MPAPTDGSVTRWISDLRLGDSRAAQSLWERYFQSTVRMARARLKGARHPGAVDDEEDAALSVLNGVLDGLTRGKYPQLADRDELWRLLVVATARKAASQARDARRLKRGGGRVCREADLADDTLLAGMIGAEPSPEFAAMVAEEFQARLDALGDDELRRVARWRLEGYDLEEIAARLGCGTRTVKRRLDQIRKVWQAPGAA